MTVSYKDEGIIGLLVRWKGSVWKVIWKEYIVFITFYGLISLAYRFALSGDQKQAFNNAAIYLDNKMGAQLPITFLLGFYVSSVVNRWWSEFMSLSWPDDVCCFLNVLLPGSSLDVVAKRRANARYLIAACVLGWRDISSRVRKRFPTYKHIIDSKVLTKQEMIQILVDSAGRG